VSLAAEYGLTDEQMQLVKTQCVAPDAPDDVLRLHMQLCKNYGFDPMGNMLVWQKRWDKRSGQHRWNRVTTIDGFRSIAGDTGEFQGRIGPHFSGNGDAWIQKDESGKPLYDENGLVKKIWVEAWVGTEPPVFARVGIWRTGFREPLFTVCRWDSYVQTDREGAVAGLWRSMPEVMLAKCAEASALRAAFPKRLAGLYERAEMLQADNPERRALPQTAPKALPPAPRGLTKAEAVAAKMADLEARWLALHPGGDFAGWARHMKDGGAKMADLAARIDEEERIAPVSWEPSAASQSAAPSTQPETRLGITEGQRRLLFATLNGSGLAKDDATRHAWYATLGLPSTSKDWLPADYEKALAAADKAARRESSRRVEA
jgi:phage recombination protein Bet